MTDPSMTEAEAVLEDVEDGFVARAASINGDHTAPSTSAEHPLGIMYQGPWETLGDGTSRAVRRHARALADTGIPVLLKSYSHTRVVNGVLQACYGDYDPEVLSEIGELHHTSIERFPLVIKHLVAKTPDQIRNALFPRGAVGVDAHETVRLQAAVASATVLYTVWERSRIPEEMARIMARAGQCWVPSYQNRNCLIQSGVPAEKVFVVPHPFSPAERDRARSKANRVGMPPKFYTIGAWQPRKGYHELIGAFLKAFSATPVEGAALPTLCIKTTDSKWPSYPSPRESIMQWLGDREVIANGWTAARLRGVLDVQTKHFTDEQIHDLHRNNNIYVSCSHGEGWGLPAFDAKLYGNRMVFVPWGGPVDFCDERDIEIEINQEPVLVPREYGWNDGTWVDFSMSELIRSLRVAAVQSHGSDGANRHILSSRFSMHDVGYLMRDLLMMLAETVCSPEVRSKLFGG